VLRHLIVKMTKAFTAPSPMMKEEKSKSLMERGPEGRSGERGSEGRTGERGPEGRVGERPAEAQPAAEAPAA
jgi:hypothetical protein